MAEGKSMTIEQAVRQVMADRRAGADGAGGLGAAAFPRVPAPLVQQLAQGGRLVQPIGRGGNEEVLLFEKRGERLLHRRFITGAHFVPLYGRHGFAP